MLEVDKPMEKPILVVMAAGMGSRYGGLKQIDPVGKNGELIIDYSIFDAKRAGFETVVFIIKEEIEKDFKEAIGERISKNMNVKYVYQKLTNLPEGYELPEERVKPWGTCHAVLSAKGVINGPFAVINADDYYGAEAFKLIFEYLNENKQKDGTYKFAMVGYRLENTLTENGHVARGVCTVNSEGFLENVVERVHIETDGTEIKFTEDGGKTFSPLTGNETVSMNMWGFTLPFLQEAENGFTAFLDKALAENPLKAEYFLPTVVSNLIDSGKAKVKVLESSAKWYGVTYKEDKPVVMAALAKMHENGTYPEKL